MKVFFRVLLATCVIILADSCKHDLENVPISGDWQVPLAYADVNLSNIAADSVLSENPDSSLTFNWYQDLADYTLGGIIQPIETGLEKTIKLNSISLGTTSIHENLSLGTLAKGAGTIGAIIIFSHGTENVIPAINNLANSSFPVDASEYFESMTLDEGNIVLRFTNGFPIDITNLQYGIENQVGGQIIFQDTIDTLYAGTFEERIYPLDGKTLDGLLNAVITKMSSPGSYGDSVLIDTSDAIEIDLTIKDLVPTSATAIFPQQQIANDTAEHPVDVGDKLKLNRMILRSGSFELEANSTIQDTVRFIYQLPGMKLNGQSFITSGKLPPAPPGGISTITQLVDFTGYTLDLTSINGDTANTFYDIFEAWIDSSGNLTYLSLEDSIYINSFTTNVLPEKAYGQILRDSISLEKDTFETDIFNSYLGGLVSLDQVNAKLIIDNSFGVSALLKPISISSLGKVNKVDLQSSSMGQFASINPATDLGGSNVSSSKTEISWTETNSNIDLLLESLPESLVYEADIIINPSNSTNEAFLLYDSGLKSGIEVEFPLNIGFDQFTLKDTADFNLVVSDDFSLEGLVKVYAKNKYPFRVGLDMEFYNEFDELVMSLNGSPLIDAGTIGVSGKVEEPFETITDWPLSIEEIQNLSNATYVVFTAQLHSAGNQNQTIYSDYNLKLNLVGEWSGE